MTTENELPTANPESEEPPCQPQKRCCWWYGLLAIITLAAFGLAAYSLYQSKQLIPQKQALLEELAKLRAQQQQVEQQLADTKQKVQQAQALAVKRIEEVHHQVQHALKQRLYHQQDWLLLKARYYLELAQINAHWSANQQTTVALLKEADQLLQNLPDPRLYPVRQALAREIAQVQALPAVDVAGIMSRLDAAQLLVSQLPIKQSVTDAAPKTDKASQPQTEPWRKQLDQSLNLLGKLVVIRHNNQDIHPILSPLQQSFLRESIRMNLQEAQWAVLQNNAQVYQQSLAQVLQDITRSFVVTASAAHTLMEDLKALQQIKLDTTKPVLNETLPLLNKIIDTSIMPMPQAQPVQQEKKK